MLGAGDAERSAQCPEAADEEEDAEDKEQGRVGDQAARDQGDAEGDADRVAQSVGDAPATIAPGVSRRQFDVIL